LISQIDFRLFSIVCFTLIIIIGQLFIYVVKISIT